MWEVGVGGRKRERFDEAGVVSKGPCGQMSGETLDDIFIFFLFFAFR